MAEKEFVTKDSGKREFFKTEAVRDVRGGKGRYDLISPLALKRLAGVYERGSLKYSARNWEKGIPLCRYFDSAIRHLFMYLEGHRDEDHLAQALWNVAALIHTEDQIEKGLLPSELNDLPNYINTKEDNKVNAKK